MDISVYEVMKSGGVMAGNTCCCDFDMAIMTFAVENLLFLHRVLQAQSAISMQTFR